MFKLPEYFRLLGDAFEASDKVDSFDVDDSNRDEFHTLVKDQEASNLELIQYIRDNSTEIVNELGNLNNIR